DYGRVSNERLFSGPGLANIHRALCAITGDDAPALSPEAVAAGARAGDARCVQAVDVFCSALGAAAGDLVLILGAWDGLFLAGGVTLELVDALRHSGFRARFEQKGRFAPVMAGVPTRAILHPEAGLLGAAAIARRQAGHGPRAAPSPAARRVPGRAWNSRRSRTPRSGPGRPRSPSPPPSAGPWKRRHARACCCRAATPPRPRTRRWPARPWSGRGWTWRWWTSAGCCPTI